MIVNESWGDIEPPGCKSQTALDLLRTLVHDLSAFETDDPISGTELVDYMANFYQSAKSLVQDES